MDRKQFLELLGELPEKAELDVQNIEEMDCGTFIRRKISFCSEQNERIPAYLCIPKNAEPMPAIYCFHQHAGNHALGKSEVVGLEGAEDQQYATELAERGFITLSPDAICFEERSNQDAPFQYHAHHLNIRLMEGRTLLGKVLFDVSAGIDLLQSLPEVDKSQIGFIGHSYGGRTALFAPAFDHRIKASVSSCGSTNFKDMLKNNTGIQLDYVIPDFLKYGDIEDVVKLVEPSNLLILGTDEDKWSMSIDHISHHASGSFKDGSLRTQIFNGQHQFSQEMRIIAYEFLDKYLKNKQSAS
jgi:dienelactone hydrolase